MDYELKMPDLSTTGDDVDIVRWLVEVGDNVKRGQPVLEVETDKAVMEVESPVDGVLRECIAEPEATIAVGDVIARIER